MTLPTHWLLDGKHLAFPCSLLNFSSLTFNKLHLHCSGFFPAGHKEFWKSSDHRHHRCWQHVVKTARRNREPADSISIFFFFSFLYFSKTMAKGMGCALASGNASGRYRVQGPKQSAQHTGLCGSCCGDQQPMGPSGVCPLNAFPLWFGVSRKHWRRGSWVQWFPWFLFGADCLKPMMPFSLLSTPSLTLWNQAATWPRRAIRITYNPGPC
jgi:hypothetical protein